MTTASSRIEPRIVLVEVSIFFKFIAFSIIAKINTRQYMPNRLNPPLNDTRPTHQARSRQLKALLIGCPERSSAT